MVGVNGRLSGDNFFFGSAAVGGDVFPSVNWFSIDAAVPSYFSITGGLVTVTGPGLFAVPFSLTGSLCGTVSSTFRPNCVVNLPSLTGSGVVELTVITDPYSYSGLALDRATYIFTPEPNLSLAMLRALGLGVAFRRLRA